MNNFVNQMIAQKRSLIIGAGVLATVMGGGLYLTGGEAAADNVAGVKVETAFTAWQKIKRTTDIAELRNFVSTYPDSDYVGRAENRLVALGEDPLDVAEIADKARTSETVDTPNTADVDNDEEVAVDNAEITTEVEAEETIAEDKTPVPQVEETPKKTVHAVQSETKKIKKRKIRKARAKKRNYSPRRRSTYRKKRVRRGYGGC